jgi:putative serine protease PepD
MKARMATGSRLRTSADSAHGSIRLWGRRTLGGVLCLSLAFGARLALLPGDGAPLDNPGDPPAVQHGAPKDVALARSVSRTYEVVTAAVAPGVVSIAAYQTRGGLPVVLGNGSGVVLRADGVIVTNARVVAGADVLRVTFHDGETVGAELMRSPTWRSCACRAAV